ncbi:MAG: hypothetical protein ACC641_02450 [Acidiferrobacterales bacterium]
MNKADILIDIHPDYSDDKRAEIETDLRNLEGVVTAHFDANHPKAHGLFVEYNPEVVNADAILKRARTVDNQATMSGL